MQQGSCEEIQLLISRYVDDEVTPEEHELVEAHVATCEECAYRLLQWIEMAVVVTETPVRQADPALRAGLFRQINAQKEEAARKTDRVPADLTSWRAPIDAPVLPTPLPFRQRIFKAVNPVMAAAVPVFFLLGSLLIIAKIFPEAPYSPITAPAVVPPIATSEIPVAEVDGVPPAVSTKVSGVAIPAPASSTTIYMSATATLGPYTVLALRQPTPVWESDDLHSKTDWHIVRDPLYGYKVSYPSNWWTQTIKSTRYFYPWTTGGIKYSPYWVELSIAENTDGLNSETGNRVLCEGKCTPAPGSGDRAGWIDRKGSDDLNQYRVGYLFDVDYIYSLKLNVPYDSLEGTGAFNERYIDGDNIFTTMSGRLTVKSEQSTGGSAFGGTLFLKGSDPNSGSDLYMTMASGIGGGWMTYDGGVKSFALSPAMDKIAYAATEKGQARDPWAKTIYLVNLGPNGSADPNTRRVLVNNMDTIQDIAWYSDRELLFLARDNSGVLGLYKLNVLAAASSDAASTPSSTPELLTALDFNKLAGARSLAVAPDRQLITFLAPLGETSTTDLYGVRPDGSDLHVIISHSDPIAILKDGVPVLAPESQAIKSYVWMEGHLEKDGYAARVLFTTGNNYSPISVLGGALYSGPRSYLNPIVDPFDIVAYMPERLQIIHIAYSSWGKVAFTGYYNDINGQADKLEGLWVADVSGDHISTPKRVQNPEDHNGVTDLQWSPDGESLTYRETMPSGNAPSARYSGDRNFRMIKLDLNTNETSVLYNSAP